MPRQQLLGPLRPKTPKIATVLAVAVSVASLIAPLGSASAAGTPVHPRTPANLPHDIEGLASYVPADSCAPVVRQGTEKLGRLLTATYPGTSFGITRSCGDSTAPTSEHYDGRAIDWMVSARTERGRARVKALLTWLFAKDQEGDKYANVRRLGVMYIIWNNRMWRAYDTARGWTPYSDCKQHPGPAYDTTCHRNHVHISLSWAGATGRTSFWTKQVATPDYGPCRQPDMNWAAPYTKLNLTPCDYYPPVHAARRASALDKALTAYSGMRLHNGSTGTAVRSVQRAVHLSTVTGTYGTKTTGAVRRWQRAHDLKVTGVVGIPTWRSFLAEYAPKKKA